MKLSQNCLICQILRLLKCLNIMKTAFIYTFDLADPVDHICSACGSVHHVHVHSIGWICVEDLPICGKRTSLHIPKRTRFAARTMVKSGSSSLTNYGVVSPVALRKPAGFLALMTKLSTASFWKNSPVKNFPRYHPLSNMSVDELKKARTAKNSPLADLLHCRKRFILMR